jgi:hypothetical protein
MDVNRNSKPSFGLELSPNPSNSSVSISIPTSGPYRLTLFNVMGKLVAQQQFASSPATINVADQATGIYSLHATTKDGQRYSGKLVVVQ